MSDSDAFPGQTAVIWHVASQRKVRRLGTAIEVRTRLDPETLVAADALTVRLTLASGREIDMTWSLDDAQPIVASHHQGGERAADDHRHSAIRSDPSSPRRTAPVQPNRPN